MHELQGFARLRIHPGRLDDFKRLAAQCKERVRARDTGTLQHEMYLSSDETECLVFARFRDSAAYLAHLGHVAEVTAALLQACTGDGVLCGQPSLEVIREIRDHPLTVYRPFLPQR